MTSNLFKAIPPCLVLLMMSSTLVAQDYTPLIEYGDGYFENPNGISNSGEVQNSGVCWTSEPVLADATEEWSNCPSPGADAELQSGVDYCYEEDIGEYPCGVTAEAQVSISGLPTDYQDAYQDCGFDKFATGGPDSWGQNGCGKGMATVGKLSTKQSFDFALLEKRSLDLIFISSEAPRLRVYPRLNRPDTPSLIGGTSQRPRCE